MNESGRRLRSWLELHELGTLASHFKKKFYGTWLHPRTRKPYQLDHILFQRRDRTLFSDCGSCARSLLDSDHRAVRCTVRLIVKFRRAPINQQWGANLRAAALSLHGAISLLDWHGT